MAKQGGDIPGNAAASAALFTQQLVRLGTQLTRYDVLHERLSTQGFDVVSVTVRMPSAASAEYLLVARAESEGKALVAFVRSDSFADVLRRFAASLENATLVWKDDRYRA